MLAFEPDSEGHLRRHRTDGRGYGRAIAQAGKAGKVIAVGFDGNEDLKNFVK